MSENFQYIDIQKILKSNKNLATFIKESLSSSLSSIGYSKSFLDDLLNNLENLDVKKFGLKWQDELTKIFSIGFYQNLVPKYFNTYVVPATPSSKKIIDVGCGRGFLAKRYSQDNRFGQVIGIDINTYPEWKTLQNEKVRFEVVKEDYFTEFLKKEKPDSVVLTWVLHHMKYDEQQRYLEYVQENLKTKSKIIILEDSYSTSIAPENGLKFYNKFMQWNTGDRQKIMFICDWIANRILGQKEKMPVPGTFRTLEDWSKIFEKRKFKTLVKKFIGFPNYRDINTPQSLLVVQKK